jgi:transglutaminase-like putative cysteine protease
MKLNASLKLFTALFAFVALINTSVSAQESFLTDYNITYTLDQAGIANVKHVVNITNLESDVIATSYTLGLKQMDIYDVTASDENGKLDITQKQEGDQTNLDIKLNSFTIGEGRQYSITILYKSKYVASKIGEVWNVNIPRSQATSSSANYHITLIVPRTFGPKIYISPTPSLEKSDNETTTYSFATEIMRDRNISASFGDYQVLNYRIRYQIANPNLFTSNYEIALPPTINGSQIVAYENLNPEPSRTYIDGDGNYMAVYRLKPNQELSVELKGSAKLTGKQVDPIYGGKFDELSKSVTVVNTQRQTFWEVDDPVVKEVADKLKDPTLTVAQNANKIYDYLVENYSYDFSIAKKDFVDRKGAAKALADKAEWGCMEFTDSFIAIARAMGIPAREINGYAITSTESIKPISVTFKNGDLLHAWPEYYDPKLGWVQIDPTWGDTSNTDYFTKLDTNHFAFVVKGKKSDYPLPAGTYRLTGIEKLVEVGFSQVGKISEFEGNFETKKLFTWNIFEVLMGKKTYKVTNTGKVALFYGKDNVLLPGKSSNIYVPKSAKSIMLKDAFGNETTKPLI